MKNQGIYVSLDIGTTSIKVVVAEYIRGQLNIIGVGNEKSQGLSRGVIVDIDETVESIKKAVKQAEQKSNIEIKDVIEKREKYNNDPYYSVAMFNRNSGLYTLFAKSIDYLEFYNDEKSFTESFVLRYNLDEKILENDMLLVIANVEKMIQFNKEYLEN